VAAHADYFYTSAPLVKLSVSSLRLVLMERNM